MLIYSDLSLIKQLAIRLSQQAGKSLVIPRRRGYSQINRLDPCLRGDDEIRPIVLIAQRGFSYIEILLAVILLAVLLVPAMQALNTAIMGSTSNLAERQLKLRNKMEEMLSKPFGELYALTDLPGINNTTAVRSVPFSDAAGVPNRRVVVFYRYDVTTNALSDTDTGVLFVSVYYEAEGSAGALSTLVGRWW